LASVFVPGFVIHKVVKLTKWGISGNTLKGNKMKKFIPVMAGLCAIPFIVKPIDMGVDLLMDKTYRSLFKEQ